jgi:hypothetical protein
VKVGPGDYVLWVLLAVGVKATTTEGMGFEGRGEGVSATAVCLLERALRGQAVGGGVCGGDGGVVSSGGLASSSLGFSSSVPLSPVLKPRMLCPTDLPSPGSREAPNSSTMIAKMMSSSGAPIIATMGAISSLSSTRTVTPRVAHVPSPAAG